MLQYLGDICIVTDMYSYIFTSYTFFGCVSYKHLAKKMYSVNKYKAYGNKPDDLNTKLYVRKLKIYYSLVSSYVYHMINYLLYC